MLAVEVLRLEVGTPMLVAVQLADHISYEFLTIELIASKEKYSCRTHAWMVAEQLAIYIV